MTDIDIRHFHLFCGLGGAARGFNRGEARAGTLHGRFRCIGGVDVDAASIRDFGRLAGVEGTLLDLFDCAQYTAFHGRPPPAGWREATPADIQAAAGGERPHIVFLSAPCKGFSGLLAEGKSKTDKYQALNGLTLRGVWLMLEAWADDPPEMVVFENVPRIMSRGRPLLDRIGALIRSYGYAWEETTHNCGEIGGLAQNRRRFLGVARHMAKVPPFLYEPAARRVRGVGEVLERLPVPGPEPLLPMHRVPRLQWKTWVRLAFVEAGRDWRSLDRLTVEDGYLKDYAIEAGVDWHAGVLGVHDWSRPSGTVTGRSSPTNGAHAVADPRIAGHAKSVQHGVRPWGQASCVVTGKMLVGGGPHAVADPRAPTGAGYQGTKYHVVGMDQTARTVLAANGTGNGAFAVADPRPAAMIGGRAHYSTGGHYGVVDWREPSFAVSGAACHDNGRFSIADPRPAAGAALPAANQAMFAVIRALDGTWHRPFTTLELAALQGLADPEEVIELDGLSDSAWRERIGNAVPPPAAAAIAGVMGKTLLMAWSGQTFALSNEPIWVRSVATALTIDVLHGSAHRSTPTWHHSDPGSPIRGRPDR